MSARIHPTAVVEAGAQFGADVTVGALRVNPVEARQFGVMEIDNSQRIVGFEEKVPNPKTIPGDPEHCLGSMGIYVFAARFLFELNRGSALVSGSPVLSWLVAVNFLHFAVVLFVICTVVLIGVSLVTAPPPPEKVDGIIWSWRYAKLPEELKQRYSGWRDYRIWWALFVLGILSIYGFFFWFQFVRS